LRFASLGSGSEGNALVVEAADGTGSSGARTTRVLLDCGFGLKETERRLARLGLMASDLDAIIVTHEHGDHIGGVPRLARKYGIPVWMTHGTLAGSSLMQAEEPRAGAALRINLVDHHRAFAIGGLEIEPFPVPHDAREPAQYVFSNGECKLGVLTDLGGITLHVTAMLSACSALVLECNHDAALLAAGPYPLHLKERVGGRYGHLDNAQAAALLRDVRHARLKHVIAAHLSKQNNTPELARAALAAELDCAPEWIGVADQDEGFAWRDA
jgi:phosphoribosyl 1,2-cyclic phosphodiesterase